MRKLIIGVAVFIIAIIVIYGGIVIYGNFYEHDKNTYNVPDANKATYKAIIRNSGNTLYSDEARKDGSIVVLNGYWELVGQKYKYRNSVSILDENIFGTIDLVKRQ